MAIHLIAIHGNGGGGSRFARLRPHLPADIVFHTPTLPGFDGVAADPTLTSLRAFADHICREIEALPRPRVVLGHGIGGSMVLELLQHYPEVVDGAILHAPVGASLEQRRFPRLMNLPLARRLGQRLFATELLRPLWTRRLFAHPIPRDVRDTFFEGYKRSTTFGQFFDWITPEWFNGLHPVDTPAALLWGGNERVLGVEQAAHFLTLLPRAISRTVPGWDHFPMLEQPAEYATEIAALARQLTEAEPLPPLTEGLLWLGSGNAASRAVGNKGALLDMAKAKGLPVPDGVIVRHEAYVAAKGAGLITEAEGKIQAPDPAALIAYLGIPRWRKNVAVRSAFSAEDTQASATAGYFASRLNVNSEDGTALAAALCEVWASAGSAPEIRRDVLILEMVKAVRAGVAFTESDYDDDVANMVRGTAEKLVGGLEQGERLELPKLREWEQELPALKLKAGPARLQRLLRDVRTAFGDTGWDIEWADDGTRCYLIQLRPITRPLRRNETFTLANHKEILPDLPSQFMATLIESCADGLFEWYRQFDRTLPKNRPFIETFYGRPLINLSLLEEMMRRWGLPTQLVTTNIGGGSASATGLNVARMVRNIPLLLNLGFSQLIGFQKSQWRIEGFRGIQSFVEGDLSPRSSFAHTITTLQNLYVELVNGMFSLTMAMSVPLALLRRFGVLDRHQAQHETIATALYHDLDGVRAQVTEEMRPILARGEVPSDPAFRAAWQGFLAKHGHRGIYESDVARPRYHEAPTPLLMALAIPVKSKATEPEQGAWLTEPLWQFAAKMIRQREELRYAAMLSFDQVRRQLLALAARAVAQGQLPSADHLWQLTITEAKRLDTGWRPEPAFWAEREAEIATLAALQLPDTLKRFDPLPDSTKRLGATSQLSGLPLTKGVVTGRAWVLQEPSTILPEGFHPQETILIARSVDAGWIATFGMVAGVVVETGGDLSHGSIILREIGLPAITNVADATRAFATGDPITLSAQGGFVAHAPKS